MNEAATKAIELVEKGVATLGKHGPEIWERMVTYHLAMTVANWSMALMAVIAGAILIWTMGFPSHKKFQDADHNDPKECAAIAQGVVGYVGGGLLAIFGTIVTCANFAHTVATVWAPDISLIMKLVAKASK